MIFLTGMMGSGKTFFGKKLSEVLGIPHLDTDEIIIQNTNQSIDDIFKTQGNEAFRKLEKETLKYICKNYTDSIISTGGGIILDYDNIEMMKKHGKIIFLNRSVEDILKDIDTRDRPLIKEDKTKLYEIYNQRIEVYKKYADFEVLSTDRETTLLQLLDYIKKAGRK